MADFAARHVTTVRREFTLRTPTNWAEIGKVFAAIDLELKAAGLSDLDSRVTAETTEEEIVFWYTKSTEVGL